MAQSGSSISSHEAKDFAALEAELKKLVYDAKEKPSKLKASIYELALKTFKPGNEEKSPFDVCERKLYAERKTQQYLLVSICSRIFDVLDEIIALHQKGVPLSIIQPRNNAARTQLENLNNALAAFKKRYGEDYQRILDLNRSTSAKLESHEKTNNVFMTLEAIYLWEALSRNQEQLKEYSVFRDNILKLLSGSNKTKASEYFQSLIDLFAKLYKLKDELRNLDIVSLYAHRLKQFVFDKSHNSLHYDEKWISSGEPFYVRGFARASKDYRNHFKRVTLLQSMNKSTAFDTYKSFNDILSLEEKASINPVISQEIPQATIDNMLSWMKDAIFAMTHKIVIHKEIEINGTKVILAAKDGALDSHDGPDLEDNLIGFSQLIEAELNLKYSFRLAEMIMSQINASKNSLETTHEISPEAFSVIYKTSQGLPLSHEEIALRDRRVQKQQEQIRRAKRADEEKSISQHAFTEKLAKENIQKVQAKKQEQKAAIMDKFTTLSSNKKRLLIDLLDPNENAHQRYDEVTIKSLLVKLNLINDTTLGFLVQNDATIASSSSSAPSAHRDHTTGKLNADFIRNLRSHFSNLEITIVALQEAMKGIENNSSKNTI